MGWPDFKIVLVLLLLRSMFLHVGGTGIHLCLCVLNFLKFKGLNR